MFALILLPLIPKLEILHVSSLFFDPCQDTLDVTCVRRKQRQKPCSKPILAYLCLLLRKTSLGVRRFRCQSFHPFGARLPVRHTVRRCQARLGCLQSGPTSWQVCQPANKLSETANKVSSCHIPHVVGGIGSIARLVVGASTTCFPAHV